MKFFDTLKKYANMVESENKRLKSMYAKLISEAMEAGVDEDDCIENECSKCDPDAVTSESDTKRKRANDKKCCDEADTTFEEGEDLMSAEEFFESDDVKECNESKKCPKCGKDPCVCEADDEKNLQSAEDFFDPAKKAVVECDKDDMIGLDTEDVEESNDACVEESEEEIAEESEDSDADDMNEKEEWMDAKEFFEDEDEEDKKTKPVEEAQRWLSAEDLLNGKLVGEKEDIDEDDISADDFFESEDDQKCDESDNDDDEDSKDDESKKEVKENDMLKGRKHNNHVDEEDDNEKLAESLNVYRKMNARLFQG